MFTRNALLTMLWIALSLAIVTTIVTHTANGSMKLITNETNETDCLVTLVIVIKS